MDSIISRLEKILPRNKVDIFGKNSLIHSPLPYYILAALTAYGLFQQKVQAFFLIALVYSGFPLLDEIFSLDERNPSEKQRIDLQRRDAQFRVTLYAAMILDWAVFIKLMINMQTFTLDWSNCIQLFAMTFIASNLASAQFAVAHQVMHKPNIFYRIIATLHMSKLYYMHFTYHHLYRHHYQVATPNDPSTSIKGQTVYQFVVRCIKNSWKGVYNDEKKLGKSFFQNYAVLSIFASIGFATLVYLIFGLQPMIIHSLVAFGSIFYLEAINYIEHYGLQRKKLDNGEYEKVTILHSWNAPHRFTNYLFFKLQRHSDHHQNSLKPFQTLTSLQESPFLPHGYTLMILMSFFPKIWFRVMDPLVDAYSSLKLSDKGKIEGQIRENAIIQTRKFLIRVGLSASGLFFVHCLNLI